MKTSLFRFPGRTLCTFPAVRMPFPNAKKTRLPYPKLKSPHGITPDRNGQRENETTFETTATDTFVDVVTVLRKCNFLRSCKALVAVLCPLQYRSCCKQVFLIKKIVFPTRFHSKFTALLPDFCDSTVFRTAAIFSLVCESDEVVVELHNN